MKAFEHSFTRQRLTTVAVVGMVLTAFVLAGIMVWAMVFFRDML